MPSACTSRKPVPTSPPRPHEADAAAPLIGGLVPFTTIDFPGKLAAVLFCQGCPWRCGYCQNVHLLPFADGSRAWDEILAFLNGRRGMLDAVVFSGGEPLAQPALPDAMQAVRGLGFAVGLHTAGVSTTRLRAALPLSDWVGFDVKAPFSRYADVTGTAGGRAAWASLAALLDSGRPHEVRTTVDGSVLDGDALLTMADELSAIGVRRWTLQRCRGRPGDPLADADLVARLARYFDSVDLR